eukprot:8578739-Alexandrium_andersonii.AAC.1
MIPYPPRTRARFLVPWMLQVAQEARGRGAPVRTPPRSKRPSCRLSTTWGNGGWGHPAPWFERSISSGGWRGCWSMNTGGHTRRLCSDERA